ncbi:MAG: TIGR02117 family protein [Flavobacteriales bacterium]|nr:TIGR02117 family protein [Flavobacteriales bacterium]
MKSLRKILKWGLRFVLLLIVCVALYFGSVWVCKYVTVNNKYQPTKDYIDIFVSSNGMHTDLVIPSKHLDFDWFEFLDSNQFEAAPRPDYLSFGWGDKGFYLEIPTWDDLTLKVAARAVLIPSETAMHVTYCRTAPYNSQYFKKLQIERQKLDELNQHILSYFECNALNKPQLIDCCRYDNVNDNFYEAHGSYHGFFTCNNWTNKCLKESGIKTAIWAPFASSVLHNIKD